MIALYLLYYSFKENENSYKLVFIFFIQPFITLFKQNLDIVQLRLNLLDMDARVSLKCLKKLNFVTIKILGVISGIISILKSKSSDKGINKKES